MGSEHSDVAAELWSLAETVLARIEPMLRQAVDISGQASPDPGGQSQRPQQGCTWCPVCALAALVRGEQHDLLTLLASESATILALLRQLVAEHSPRTTDSSDATRSAPEAPREGQPTGGSGAFHSGDRTVATDTVDPVVRRAKFVPITVTVKNSTTAEREGRHE